VRLNFYHGPVIQLPGESVAGAKYFSITGLKLKGIRFYPVFLWHAIRSMNQALSAEGVVSAKARKISGVYYTLSVWESREHMLHYLRSGAHKKAIKVFPKIAEGKVYGSYSNITPNWSDVPKILEQNGRSV